MNDLLLDNKKTRKGFRLSAKAVQQMEIIKQEENKNGTEVIEFLLDQYFVDKKASLDYTVERVNKSFDEKLKEIEKNFLNPIRAAANTIDLNTQMANEFWNHHYASNPTARFGTTDKVVSPEVKYAKELVKKRISSSRQKKLERQNGMKENKNV